MIETFYAHLEFKSKNSKWSINLPFLCNKCGVCCTLDDFLTAGETKPNPEVDAKVKALFEELGERWEANEVKYDEYVTHTPCPFLVNKACSIYEFRPEGCRVFPKTAFGMLTEDCMALTRFKKQRVALKKGRATTESYFFTKPASGESPKPVKFTEKRYQSCIAKLRQAGITDEELALFNLFNGKNKD
jgi:Fe-S-cluster containining protein